LPHAKFGARQHIEKCNSSGYTLIPT